MNTRKSGLCRSISNTKEFLRLIPVEIVDASIASPCCMRDRVDFIGRLWILRLIHQLVGGVSRGNSLKTSTTISTSSSTLSFSQWNVFLISLLFSLFFFFLSIFWVKLFQDVKVLKSMRNQVLGRICVFAIGRSMIFNDALY